MKFAIITIMDKIKIRVPRKKLEDFCRRNHIRKLAFFGSVLRDDFGPDSDVDVLVEFEPGKMPGFAPEDYQESHPEIPWAQIIGMRNRLIHGYDEVDLNFLWSVVQNDLPG
jgi:predicted nucleotidyltransferase